MAQKLGCFFLAAGRLRWCKWLPPFHGGHAQPAGSWHSPYHKPSLEPPTLVDLLTLPRLPRKKMHGKEPLVDYSISDVVTLNQYLVQLKQRAMEKEVAKNIKELKANEREEKRSNRVYHTLTQEEWTTQRNIEKQDKTKFN